MAFETQITVDFLVIARCLLALLWGIGWALMLQYHRLGRFLAAERTWITVVVGVGVDLLIGINADWFTICGIVVLSSLGIIARSLINESQYEPDLNAYKTKWAMEDTIDGLGQIIGLLEVALTTDKADAKMAQVSGALTVAHKIQRAITNARYGEPEGAQGRKRK